MYLVPKTGDKMGSPRERVWMEGGQEPARRWQRSGLGKGPAKRT